MSSNRSQMMLSCLVITLGLLAHTSQAQMHASVASAGVSFATAPSPPEGFAASGAVGGTTKPRNRRIYAMCPPQFQRVGIDCYSLVSQRSSWLDAQFFCKDKNSNLAEPSRFADRKLRTFLKRQDTLAGEHDPIWIGASYDHRNRFWQWNIAKRNLSNNAFSQMDPTYVQLISNSKPLENNCGVYDPKLKYRWSARSCPDKLRFICQHKMPKVSEANRYKIYNRWNVTYPNALANEVILEVIGGHGNDRRNQRRVKAEGSAEEMIIPKPRRRGHGQRRKQTKPQQHQPPHYNDVNSSRQPQNKRPRKHPNSSTTSAPANVVVGNQWVSSIGGQPKAGTQQPMTEFDRKLQIQREKERRRINRMQRRRRLQEQHRKEIEMEKQRQQQQKQQQQQQQQQHTTEPPQQQEPQSEPDALRQRTQAEHEKQQREQQEQLERQQKQKAQELQQLHDEEERQRAADDEALRMREKRLQKQREREEEIRREREEAQRKRMKEQEEANRLYLEERLAENKRILEEQEKRLQEAKLEQERKLKEAHEAKLREEEAVREQLKEQERQRQEQILREQKEEEKRLEDQRREETIRFEEQELKRLREENARIQAQEKQREAEIEALNAEKRRLAEDEERLKMEIQQEQKSRSLKLEQEMKEAEEQQKRKKEAEQAAAEAAANEQKRKYEEANRIENEKVKQQLNEKHRKYASRIAKLRPEDQLRFAEMRKLRKQMKEKQMRAQEQKKLKRIQEAIADMD